MASKFIKKNYGDKEAEEIDRNNYHVKEYLEIMLKLRKLAKATKGTSFKCSLPKENLNASVPKDHTWITEIFKIKDERIKQANIEQAKIEQASSSESLENDGASALIGNLDEMGLLPEFSYPKRTYKPKSQDESVSQCNSSNSADSQPPHEKLSDVLKF